MKGIEKLIDGLFINFGRRKKGQYVYKINIVVEWRDKKIFLGKDFF